VGGEKTRLSWTISEALCHNPAHYGLEPDSEGWVPVADLLAMLVQRRDEWRQLTEADLKELIATSDKKLFDIRNPLIRALKSAASRPPALLYHGTDPAVIPLINAEGLKPMQRQYVYLAVDKPTAIRCGQRKTKSPRLLRIRAADAHDRGVAFYPEIDDEYVWLADGVPFEFIEEEAD
jgi:putative RNA 2'-phosphotransferase